MNIFILLALVLGASASRGHEGHEHSAPKPRACCFGMTANCLACSEGMTEERYCAINPDTSGCKTEVELSALDHLEAPLAHSVPKPKCCRTRTAECMACVVGITKKEFCLLPAVKGRGYPGCGSVLETEVELSALDNLEALLARMLVLNEGDKCYHNRGGKCGKGLECLVLKRMMGAAGTCARVAPLEEGDKCYHNNKGGKCGKGLQCLVRLRRMGAAGTCEPNKFELAEMLETLLSDGAPKPRSCCRAYTAQCMACVADITIEEFCLSRYAKVNSRKGREYPGCKSELKTEVELSALDHLEAPLARARSVPKPKCCRTRTAECMACEAGVSKKEFCDAMKRFAFMGTIKGC